MRCYPGGVKPDVIRRVTQFLAVGYVDSLLLSLVKKREFLAQVAFPPQVPPFPQVGEAGGGPGVETLLEPNF